MHLFIYLGFYVTFNTVQVISQQVVGMAEETSTYSWSRFYTLNCRPTASSYQLSHLKSVQELNPDLRGGRRECYHSATVAPQGLCMLYMLMYLLFQIILFIFRKEIKVLVDERQEIVTDMSLIDSRNNQNKNKKNQDILGDQAKEKCKCFLFFFVIDLQKITYLGTFCGWKGMYSSDRN